MFEWIELIGQAVADFFSNIASMFNMFVVCVDTVNSAIKYAPDFLAPIMYLILAVAIVMWVVNLL